MQRKAFHHEPLSSILNMELIVVVGFSTTACLAGVMQLKI